MTPDSSLERILKSSSKAILLGIGGGGDIVGTLPTAGLLRAFGVECVHGGLSWERSVFDPVPGPRKFTETRNARKINDTVWWANKDTVTSTGVRFAEAGFAEVFDTETLLVDVNRGPGAVADGLRHAIDKIGADLIIGVDVGGDAVAFGSENGLLSPLADSIMTAALTELEREFPTVMGVFGFGSDGELTQEEVERSLNAIAKEGGILGSWGITRDTLREMERAIEVVPTEASRIPAECARGLDGETTIRSGTRSVTLSFVSTVTFYMSPGVVFEHISSTARAVAPCKSLQEAHEALHALGLRTELDIELDRLKKMRG
ncbi:MAG: DUF1152 domain-containing protein [Thermodesulfobacteriota bacterium]